MRRSRLITRIALFSALVYLLSWATAFMPNVNLVFFIVFTSGLVWGALPGVLVGLVGMGLWTAFNPYGPAMLPIMVAQCLGAGCSGPVGALFDRTGWRDASRLGLGIRLASAALACTAVFYLPVNLIDAWLFQPFWPRFVVSMVWSGWALASNVFIFILLFGAARRLYSSEGINK
ncbi:MAG: hypothetical protein ABIE70_00900 [bacterium]